MPGPELSYPPVARSETAKVKIARHAISGKGRKAF
jgi:hypothetical protein